MGFSVLEFAYTVLAEPFIWGAAVVAIFVGASMLVATLFDIFDGLIEGG